MVPTEYGPDPSPRRSSPDTSSALVSREAGEGTDDMTQSPAADSPGDIRAERRLPMALAVVAAGVLYLFIPAQFRVHEYALFAYPAVLLLLLVLLVIGDPGRIDREVPWLRTTTGLLIALITLTTAFTGIRLVIALLQGDDGLSPAQLLVLGAVVWTTNVVAFSLCYWHLDGGGPVARYREETHTRPAFHFPEQSLPMLVDSGWYPQYVDYLALSFNTSTAFSPTDVSAIRHWSKLALIVQSAVSLVLVALVVARAVNVL